MTATPLRRRSTRRLAGALCALALVAAACGSDDTADESSDTTEADSSATTVAGESEIPEDTTASDVVRELISKWLTRPPR